MIEKISQHWKGISGLVVAAVLVGSFGVGVPLNAIAGIFPIPPPPECTTGTVLVHMDKIIFQPNGKFFIHSALDTLFPTRVYDIKVVDNPNEVKYIQEEVAAFLNAAGYTRGGGGPIQPWDIYVVDVDYSTECVESITPG